MDSHTEATPQAQEPGRRSRRRIHVRALRLVVPAVLFVLWVTVTSARLVGPLFFPSPMDLVDSYDGLRPLLAISIVSSVAMTLTGFALGCSFGAGLGLVMAYSRLVRELLGGIFDFIRPVPVFALIPLFVLWFGIGSFPQIALIALGTSVLLGVTTLEAIKNVPSVYVKAALTLGASRSQIYRTVIVPSILPHLLGAIRVAAAASWGLDVAAEFIGAQNGLGYLMVTREQYLDTAGIILICLIYCVLAISMDRVIRSIQAPMLAWSERGSSGVVGSIVGND